MFVGLWKMKFSCIPLSLVAWFLLMSAMLCLLPRKNCPWLAPAWCMCTSWPWKSSPGSSLGSLKKCAVSRMLPTLASGFLVSEIFSLEPRVDLDPWSLCWLEADDLRRDRMETGSSWETACSGTGLAEAPEAAEAPLLWETDWWLL